MLIQLHVFIDHCPTDLSLDNGYIKYNRDLTVVGFQCVSGYQLDGSPLATCNEDHTWSSPTPKCVGTYDDCSNTIFNASKTYLYIVIIIMELM